MTRGMTAIERATFFVLGTVQGVGFRWWTRSRALELGLAGYARNLADGRVEVCAQGPLADLERLETLLFEEPSQARRPGHVTGVTAQWGAPLRDDLAGFQEC